MEQPTLSEFLANRIEIDPETHCHIWTGPTTRQGQGRISNSHHFAKLYGTTLIHRIAYMDAKGRAPAGTSIRNRCGHLNCCNPDHLYNSSVEKFCTSCHTPLIDTNWSPAQRDRNKYRCRTCIAETRKEWLARNPTYHSDWVDNNRDLRNSYTRKTVRRKWCDRYWLKLLAGRAKAEGVPFSLTTDNTVIPEKCPVLGIPLVRHEGSGPRVDSPSMDRFDPSLGYVPGNVMVISHRANTLKGNRSHEDLLKVVNSTTATTPYEHRLAVYEWVVFGKLNHIL